MNCSILAEYFGFDFPPERKAQTVAVRLKDDAEINRIDKTTFQNKQKPIDNLAMFSTSKSEDKEMLVSIGQLTIGEDFLKIENYPFEPSIAYRQTIFKRNQIDDIDFKSYPPTFRVGKELIYLTSEKKVELKEFATRNNIKTIDRPKIWSWILEPFLDTEFTAESNEKLSGFLEKYGLKTDQIKSIRAEVEIQMHKYNFDTMLWEWIELDTLDVLKAMRIKYNKDEFRDFYKRTMNIALLKRKFDK